MPKRSSPLLAGVLFITACGGAASPPPSTAIPPSPPVAASVASPALPEDTASITTAPAPPPPAPVLAEPLPPLTRPIVTVTLPGVAGSLIAVHGRSSNDIWFLTDEDDGKQHLATRGAVFRYDGKRVVEKHVPCSSYSYFDIVVGKDEVVAIGSNVYFRGVPTYTRSYLHGRGKFGCGDAYSLGATVSSGDHVWRLSCSYDGQGCTLDSSRGPRAPLPTYDASFREHIGPSTHAVGALWMKGLADGWMAGSDEDGRAWLRRYNGVTWLPLAALDEGLVVVDLWVDEGEHVWIAAGREGKDPDAATTVLRFDGRALQALPVPASFAARWVRGTSAKDVWFVGAGRKVYQWDGERLRQGEAPFVVGGAWSSPGGEVWLVSTEERAPGPGVAAHTALRPEAP